MPRFYQFPSSGWNRGGPPGHGSLAGPSDSLATADCERATAHLAAPPAAAARAVREIPTDHRSVSGCPAALFGSHGGPEPKGSSFRAEDGREP